MSLIPVDSDLVREACARPVERRVEVVLDDVVEAVDRGQRRLGIPGRQCAQAVDDRQIFQDGNHNRLDVRGEYVVQDFEGEGIQVLNGRYGPYITNKEKNARVPKDREPKSLTLEECKELLAAAPVRGKRGKKKAKKKAAKKKAAKKKASESDA